MTEVNIRSLAKELNLSISTVSKALKDSYEISIETKKRVAALAKQLNYYPNPYASSLRRKKSNTVAVVIPEVADSFFSAAIKGVEEIAQTKGYHVLIYLTYESYLKEKKILEEFNNGRVDGLLMSVSSETFDVEHIRDLHSNIPVVFFDRAVDQLQTASITTNDFESSCIATKHLIGCGCTNLVYLSISECLSIDNARIKGFRKALAEHQIESIETNVIHCSNNTIETSNILSELLSSRHRPDGIIAGVEKLVAPLYSLCKELHILIPDDLKIISFSNSPVAHILSPSLTTVTQPAFEMGKTAARVLFRAIEKKGTFLNENIVLPSTLYIRESTKKTG
jgi:LacI family transcriptional regulator